jgi:hypothetical protein
MCVWCGVVSRHFSHVYIHSTHHHLFTRESLPPPHCIVIFVISHVIKYIRVYFPTLYSIGLSLCRGHTVTIFHFYIYLDIWWCKSSSFLLQTVLASFLVLNSSYLLHFRVDMIVWGCFFFSGVLGFFGVLMLVRQVLYHLSHSTSPIFKTGSLFLPAGLESWSSLSLPPE